jgi:hypothetical protein
MIPHNLYSPFILDKNISVVIDVPCINSIWRPFNSNDKSRGHHLCGGHLKADVHPSKIHIRSRFC